MRVGAIRDFHDVIEALLGLRPGQIDRHGEFVDCLVELDTRILGAQFLAFVCDDGADVVGQGQTRRIITPLQAQRFVQRKGRR